MSSPTLKLQHSLSNAAIPALQRAATYFEDLQKPEGYWCADLTADTTLESDFILLQLWLYPPQAGLWDPPTRGHVDKAAQAILSRQLPDGGFNIYAKGPSEVSASVKAYFSLKVAGVPVDDPRMTRLRDRILALGGIQSANSYVKVNLNLFDLFPRQHCPSIPPELILLRNTIYEMSSWTRVIAISLAVVHAANPRRPVPEGFNLDEIWAAGVSPAFHRGEKFLSTKFFFFQIDRAFKFWERHGLKSVRARAVERCKRWMLERFERSDGLGAIYPPMMYAIMALDVLGFDRNHPAAVEARKQFDHLIIDEAGRFQLQPCFSPIWDTSIGVYALGEAGVTSPERMQRAAGWMLSREIRRKGDWSVKRPKTEPSGWAFEFANDFYPDIDDTAMVLLALKHAKAADAAAQEACHERALNWLLAMQSKDGGWAAFDVDNNWEFLSDVPFADHNAMLDPTCPDITGRVLEALAARGLPSSHASVRRGVDYLVKSQLQDGSWLGRWGVARIYGTCFALRGLAAAGEDDREAHVLRGGEWLRSIQNADGGWGESCATYDDDSFAPAESTPSQTAWALLGLIAGGDTNSSSVRNGIEYLLVTQRPDGGWNEELATGTGFPKVFYLNYHYYKLYFPILALSAFLKSDRAHD